MLLYSPPFLMVDQVTVFPDHADPETFYYVVAVPQLVQDRGEPAFWATAILPETAVGGVAGGQDVGRALVSFDVHLPLPPDPEGVLRQEIQKRWGREPKRLVPAPLQSGKASLTVARPSGSEATSEMFVYEGHPPSLVGDNRAAFAIAAEGKEAQALVAAMSAGHLAAVMTYDLELPGLAPSFQASMKVRWSKVYKRFRERELSNFIFTAEEIDKTIESLEDKNEIDIDVIQLDPEGATAATKSLFDELKSQVVKKLFERPMPTGEVPVEERIGRGVREVLSSLMIGTSSSLRTLDQSFLADDTISLREQKVNLYPFYPQSTLAGLLERAGGAARRLQFVRIDDLPHRVEEILVEMAAGASSLGVRAVLIRVQVTSPGRDEPLADETINLSSQSSERHSVRFRRLGTEPPSVRYQAEMLLDPATAPGGRERWTFDWRPVEGQRIWFDPEEWLDVASVTIEIDDPAVFDVARVAMEVEAQLPAAETPLRRLSLPFTKESPSHKVTVIVPDGATAAFKGREIFRRIGEVDFVREVPAIGGAVHRIMNPFGQSWTMEVRAVSAWTETAALVAEFRVWDVLRKTWLLAQQQFDKAAPAFTLKFSASLETPRRAEARVTRIGNDGSVVRGPWRDLAGTVAAITDEVKPQRRIRARLSAPHFEAAFVRKVLLDLEYKDPANNVAETATPPLEFDRDQDTADWVHACPDPSRAFYRYRIRARGQNSERYTGEWTESGADDLTITLPESPWG